MDLISEEYIFSAIRLHSRPVRHKCTSFSQRRVLVGYSPSLQLLQAVADDGDSESKGFLFSFSVAAKYSLSRKNDLLVAIDYINDVEFDPSVSDIAQEVSGVSLSTIWRSKFALSRNFKPKLDIRLAFDQLEYKKQFTVDRDDPEFSILLNASMSFNIQRRSQLDVDVIYKAPIGEGLSGVGVRVTYFPRFLSF